MARRGPRPRLSGGMRRTLGRDWPLMLAGVALV